MNLKEFEKIFTFVLKNKIKHLESFYTTFFWVATK
jgi:hypothetical protein